MIIDQTIIYFPGIYLSTRDAHKLRGYFGQIFKEHSPLLHNHFENGELRYSYPLVQYKVIDKIPILMGIAEGSRLLVDLFLKLKEINIDGKVFLINSKNIENKQFEINDFDKLYQYEFKTLWMALNQNNFKKYKSTSDKNDMLNKLLIGNILSFYKGIGIRVYEKLLMKGEFFEKTTQFKNKNMLAFSGKFVTNALLPDFIGLGKSTSRGFGTIKKIY
ncbi:MAG: hypothetical protein Kow0068_15590 [Marinilabiliales bacterium]